MTTAVSDADFDSAVLQSDKPVVVDFWAEWCGPCKMIAPALDELSSEIGDVTIAKLNIDENSDTAMKYGIQSIPTLLMFKGGEVVDMKRGAAPKSDIEKWIKGAM